MLFYSYWTRGTQTGFSQKAEKGIAWDLRASCSESRKYVLEMKRTF